MGKGSLLKRHLFFFFILFGFLSYNSYSNNLKKNTNQFIKTIDSISKRISILTATIDDLQLNNYNDSLIELYSDSLVLTNKVLINKLLLTKNKFELINNSNYLNDSTILNIITSKDLKVVLFTWDTGLGLEIPSYSSVVYFLTKNNHYESKKIQHVDIFEDDLGQNLLFSDIYKSTNNEYIITGSNKCGSICLKNSLSLYRIINNEFLQIKNGIIDQNLKMYSNLSFEYLLNVQLTIDPKFIIEGKIIKMPIMDKNKTQFLKYKLYNLIYPTTLRLSVNKR
jgi:hypothetical protein